MIPNLLHAEYLGEFKIQFKFADGKEGKIDFKNELSEGIFTPLQSLTLFKEFILRKDFGTIEWPNGADFSPEFLYNNLN